MKRLKSILKQTSLRKESSHELGNKGHRHSITFILDKEVEENLSKKVSEKLLKRNQLQLLEKKEMENIKKNLFLDMKKENNKNENNKKFKKKN